MKESETPLGKAFVKAKKTSAPPPAPAPNPYDVDVKVYTKESSKDAATRKYQTLAIKNLGSNYRARLAYDKVADKLTFFVTDANTDKLVGKTQFAIGAPTAQVRRAILDTVKNVKGQPVSDADLQNATATFKAIADSYTPVSVKGSGIDA